ncbi:LytTR family DNA-binding domain-containing protein [Paratractidigestivibacter sp.]|uniref:LytR/AlgR family response regulator transcription factor n=1 Tax=Paratractidigestivibacter sp. TaxID=2847316 RepID=UPI002AC8E8BD|nr:LytTR family DNA-binding domain-containing protein [Paratractidigestivibacter sp.]
MHRILIVEDEDGAASQLQAAIERYGQANEETFLVARLKSAVGLDDAADVDLLFMDIDLPGGNGLDAAIELRKRNRSTVLVFVTNLAQYAVRGYAAEALDFIVKPFSYGDFALRMDRAMGVLHRCAGRSITVASHGETHIFAASDLICIEVRGHNVEYRLADGQTFLARASLSASEETLGGSPFLRVSSGCVINMGHVRGVNGVEVTLTGGSTVWISRANKRRCLEEISRYLGAGA